MATAVAAHSGIARRDRRLLAGAALLHLIVVAFTVAGTLDGLFFVTSLPDSRGDSLRSFYQAGVNLRTGLSPYTDPAHLDPSLERAHTASGFRYTPPVAMVFAALSAWFSPGTLYWIWLAVLEGLVLLCVWLVLCARRFAHRRYIAAAMWLVFTPYCIELHLGQMSMVMAAGILVLLLDAVGERPLGEGRARRWLIPLIWASTMLVKSFTALLAIPYLRAGRRGLVLAGTTVVLLSAGTYFLLHPVDFQRYLAVNGKPFIGIVFPGLMGFQAFVRSLVEWTTPIGYRASVFALGPLHLTGANVPSALVMMLAGFFVLWGTLRLGRDQLFSGLSLWLAIFFVVYRQVWEYHFLMLLPVVSVAYLATGALWPLLAWAVMALPTPYAFFAPHGSVAEGSPLWIAYHAVKPAAVLTILLASFPWHLPVGARARRPWTQRVWRRAREPVPAAMGVPQSATAAAASQSAPALVNGSTNGKPHLYEHAGESPG